MSSTRHARSRSTSTAAPISSEGLREDAGVTWKIQHDGWGSGVGKAVFSSALEELRTRCGTVLWQRWATPKIELSRSAYLLVIQGMQLQELFGHGCWFENGVERVLGPFLYLKGNGSGIYSAVPQLHDVVLSRLVQAPEELQPRELLGLLVARVLRA